MKSNTKNETSSYNRVAAAVQKCRYPVLYTALFAVMAMLVYSWHIFYGASLIWNEDGWNQYYKALVYYGDYLRKIVGTLIKEHSLVIPDMDFYIGEGTDLLNALHYYVIGDPLALLTVFVPDRFMHLFYSFLSVFRLYLAGLSFSALAFETGIKNKYAVLSGAISYAFCYWAMFNAARHPYFVNPLIYLPLVILGVERVIKREKPWLLIFSVMFSALTNFYFFYMIVLLTVAYVFVRMIFIWRAGRSIKQGLQDLVRIGVAAATGFGLSGFLSIPVLVIFYMDSRRKLAQPFHLFYPLGYYLELPGTLLSFNDNTYWLCMGFSAPLILALFLLFLKKGEKLFLKVIFAVCAAIILFPILGRALNGMSYMTNRWSWAFALVCSYILSAKWSELIAIGKKDTGKLFICSGILLLLCLLADNSRTQAAYAGACLLFVTLFISGFDMSTGLRQGLMLLMTCVCIWNVAFWQFSPDNDDYVKEFKQNSRVNEEAVSNEARLLKDIAGDEGYHRFTGNTLTENANMLHGISSTQYYWSISNPFVNQLRDELEMLNSVCYRYFGYDDRTAPTALSASDYYVAGRYGNKSVPFGFSKLTEADANPRTASYAESLRQELSEEELSEAQRSRISSLVQNSYTIYKNDYALPLGYGYDTYMNEETWKSLDSVQKQQAMLDTVYLSEEVSDIPEYNGGFEDYGVPYEMSLEDDDITVSEGGFITTSRKKAAKYSFEGRGGCETYIRIEGLTYTGTPEYDLYSHDESVDPLNIYNRTDFSLLSAERRHTIIKEKLLWNYQSNIYITVNGSNGVSRFINYKSADEAFSPGRHDFTVCLGYSEEPLDFVTLNFEEQGVYDIKSVKIYCVPMDTYPEKIALLKKRAPYDIELGTDSISARVDYEKPGVVVMAVPYSAGWKAYVDDEETKVYIANGCYLGIMADAGEHRITFRYSTPFKGMGICFTIAGMAALVLLWFLGGGCNIIKKRV